MEQVPTRIINLIGLVTGRYPLPHSHLDESNLSQSKLTILSESFYDEYKVRLTTERLKLMTPVELLAICSR